MSDKNYKPLFSRISSTGEVLEDNITEEQIKKHGAVLKTVTKKMVPVDTVQEPTPTKRKPLLKRQQKAVPVAANVKKETNTNKEYLILFKLEEQDMTNPDHESSRWISASSRDLIFAKAMSFIEDNVQILEDEGDIYDPVEYEESYVLTEGVTLSQKVKLSEFLKMCLKKCPKGIDDKIEKYLDTILNHPDEDARENFLSSEMVNDYGINCRPQYMQMPCTEVDGEDIN
jgi:hypothetical protein